MFLDCDISAANGYSSQPQISRILSERWFRDNAYCLSCQSDRLMQTAANTKASDFMCQSCGQDYELKAFQKRPTNTLVDGAYSAMMSRILSDSVPVLMLLERTEGWKVRSLTAIHNLFLTPEVIAKRKPLSPTARRAGWVGCNIRLDLIASDARLQVVFDGFPNDRDLVRRKFQQFGLLKNIAPSSRGWTTLTLRVIRGLNRSLFSLGEVYAKEETFVAAFPENGHIRAKIRQQLQVLRDLGYLEFHGSGNYGLLI